MFTLLNLFPLLWFIDTACNEASAKLIEASIGSDVLDTVLGIVAFKGDSARSFSMFFSIMNNGIDVIKPFGFALVTTYFLIFLFDAAAKEQITVDSLIKVMIQLVLVVTLINNLKTIIMSFFGIEESLLSLMSGEVSVTDLENTSISGSEICDNMVSENGWVHTFFQAIMIYVVHLVAVIALQFAAITRSLEIGWRVILAPIGVANCFEGGASSPGIKYLKSLFGTILSGAALYAVAAIGFALAGDFLSGDEVGWSGVMLTNVTMLATAGAAIGLSGKVKEVVG